MHYKLDSGIAIKTENAAKPHQQRSKFLQSLILDLPSVETTVDYGCGKLRYADVILKTTDTLALVDSEYQLSRDQKLRGKSTNIRSVARSSNRLSVYNTSEFGLLPTLFDRAFCINVLSVIPLLSARQRVLNLIAGKLKPGGTCLFAIQYRNSDFYRMQRLPNARRWRDGFLIDSLRGYSFYGLISPQNLRAMILDAGLGILECTLNDGSVYVIAKSQRKLNRAQSFEIDEADNFRFLDRQKR